MNAINVSDFDSFSALARRSRRTRLVLVAIAASLALAVVVAAPRGDLRAETLLPKRATGILVVDVSASISWETYARIAAAFARVRADGGEAGLVLFSDTAYQALPPGTPVAELAGFERYFRVSRATAPGLQPQPPRSPWTSSFSAGTRISTGLSLALDTIRRERLVRPLVVLVSDLDDDAGDLESLTSVALQYRRLGIPIRVVALNPSPEDARYLDRLLPEGSQMARAPLPAETSDEKTANLPGGVLVLGVLLAAALSAFLLVTERLRWGAA